MTSASPKTWKETWISKISKQFYGDANDANREKLGDPDPGWSVDSGDRLRVGREIYSDRLTQSVVHLQPDLGSRAGEYL